MGEWEDHQNPDPQMGGWEDPSDPQMEIGGWENHHNPDPQMGGWEDPPDPQMEIGGWEDGRIDSPVLHQTHWTHQRLLDISGRAIVLPLADVGCAGYAHVGDVADVSSVLHEVVQNIHFVVFGESMGLTFAHC